MQKFTCTVLLFLLSLSGAVHACSCKMFTPEEIANIDKYEFTKLKINYPTLGELWQRLQKRTSFQRPYSVTVLEDVKGKFNYSELIVQVGDIEACGTSVSYGQTLYLIRSSTGVDEWANHASVCNIMNESFSQQVKRVLEENKKMELKNDHL